MAEKGDPAPLYRRRDLPHPTVDHPPHRRPARRTAPPMNDRRPPLEPRVTRPDPNRPLNPPNNRGPTGRDRPGLEGRRSLRYHIDVAEAVQKVLFIAGTGRSGSTILARVLGAGSGLETIGEAGSIGWFKDPGSLMCGCGEQLRTCERWNSIVSAELRGLDQFRVDREQASILANPGSGLGSLAVQETAHVPAGEFGLSESSSGSILL